MRIPKAIGSLIESFERLPGIGPKSAQRLTYYLLHVPQRDLEEFGENLTNLKKNTVLCSVCKNVGEKDPCNICTDEMRDKTICLVVEQPLDLIAFERSGKYHGQYHVLHGAINPLENIGPDEIYVADLLKRLKEDTDISELVVATNPTMEGEATAMYLKKQIAIVNSNMRYSSAIKVSRLGMGIPTGADLEYADDVTLTQALEGRREL
jgi:recombination protein RecR